MKAHDINAALSTAGMTTLSLDQLGALCNSSHRKRFGDAIKQLMQGEDQEIEYLRCVTGAHGQTILTTLASLGREISVSQCIDLAIQEGPRFFLAVAHVEAKSQSADMAAAYLSVVPVPQTLATKPTTPAPAPYYSFKVFARTGALCFSEAKTRGNDEPTIQIEGAQGQSIGGAVNYDWQKKIIIQLSVQECCQLLALHRRYLTSLLISGHGAKHDEFLEIQHQGKSIFFRVGQKSKAVVAVPVELPDALRVEALLLRQLTSLFVGITPSDMDNMLQRLGH